MVYRQINPLFTSEMKSLDEIQKEELELINSVSISINSSSSYKESVLREIKGSIYKSIKELPNRGTMSFDHNEEHNLDVSKRKSYAVFLVLSTRNIIPHTYGLITFYWGQIPVTEAESLSLNFDDYFELKEEHRSHKLNLKYGL